jgi:hypothetical protein
LSENTVLKVSRERAERLIEDVEDALPDEQALQSLFDTAQRRLGWMTPKYSQASGYEVPSWLTQLYKGPLDIKSLTELGVSAS